MVISWSKSLVSRGTVSTIKSNKLVKSDRERSTRSHIFSRSDQQRGSEKNLWLFNYYITGYT